MSFLKKYNLIFILLGIWQLSSSLGALPSYVLPSPYDVVLAFIDDFPLLMYHSRFTLYEAFVGTSLAIVLAFLLSLAMDMSPLLHDLFYAPLVLTQTIPSVAIAPLLIIWLGYYSMPKIVLVLITVFFPILVALLDGYRSVDPDGIRLLRAMGANQIQIYQHVKLPASLSHFFSGLRVSLSYALISAVVAEWLGGYNGLGVYMTRVRKAFAIDKMFAVIFFISTLSLLLMFGIDKLRAACLRHERSNTSH